MLLDNVLLSVNDVDTLLAHIGDTLAQHVVDHSVGEVDSVVADALDGRGVAIERIDGAA